MRKPTQANFHKRSSSFEEMHVWMLRRYSLQSVHDYMFVISDSESVHVVRQLLLSGHQFNKIKFKKKKKTRQF